MAERKKKTAAAEAAEEAVKTDVPVENADETAKTAEKPKAKKTRKKAEVPAEEPAEEVTAEDPAEESEPADAGADDDDTEVEYEDQEKPNASKKTKEKAEEPAEEPAAPRKRKNNILKERKRAVDKNLSEDEKIEQYTSRSTFSGAIASKERRKELKSDIRVITENGDEPVVTMATIREEEYKELRGASIANKILSGEVMGVHATDPDNPESTVLVDVRYKSGSHKVSIPSYLYFDYDKSAFKGESGQRDLIEALKKRITGTISFVPSYVSQDEGLCYADRLRAMSMKSSLHYLNNWKGTNKPHIYPGLIGQGRIMAVGHQYVVIEVLGAEIRVPLDELSYIHIGDARNEFSVDEIKNVYITEVTEKNIIRGKNSYKLAAVKGSIKKAYPNEKKKHFDEFRLHQYVSATVTYIDDDLHVFCSLNGGIMDCICPYPSVDPKPMVGQKRVVEITGRDEEALRLFGTFRRN